MAKYVINTPEDYITIEADGLATQENGELTAYQNSQPGPDGQVIPFRTICGFAPGFWYSWTLKDALVEEE